MHRHSAYTKPGSPPSAPNPAAAPCRFDLVLVDSPAVSINKKVPEGQLVRFAMEHERALLMMHLGCACGAALPTFLFLAKHSKRELPFNPAELVCVRERCGALV